MSKYKYIFIRTIEIENINEIRKQVNIILF